MRRTRTAADVPALVVFLDVQQLRDQIRVAVAELFLCSAQAFVVDENGLTSPFFQYS